MDLRFVIHDTLGSTNTEAAEQARKGAGEGLCIVALAQTAGRGRHGRTWESEPGQGAYFSLVLRPDPAAGILSLIPLAAAVAVHEVLERDLKIEPDIKWPNDVLVAGKKICGILSEAADTPAGLAVIVGIGINLKDPLEAENATSIASESAFSVKPEDLARAVAEGLASEYDTLLTAPAEIIARWRERSTYFSGTPVRAALPDRTIEGVTDGLEPNGALRVKLSDGSTTIVQAGDVERLRRQ